MNRPGYHSFCQVLIATIACLAGFPGFAWEQRDAESADGTRIAYYVRGDLNAGDVPLLVISGGPGSDHRYMRVGGSFDELASRIPVIMFDQRGTSNSGAVTWEPRLLQWTQDVEAIRKSVGAPALHLLGHSFGGFVAMDYASRFGDRLRSMILVDSTAATISGTRQMLGDVFPDQIDQWRQVREKLTPRFKASDIEVFTRMEFVDPEARDRFLKAIAGYTYNIEVNNALRVDMAGLDFEETLSAFEKPALVIHGRFDAVIAPITSWELHQTLPNSRLAIIERTGHLPFAERPREFVDAVESFLASHSNP
ncbi:MAG: alpha/beta hydrolase [Xanthomonadales bacterium]|nr:alpha/beta hydrolase [Xanthomonadales bacterium]